MSFTKYKCPFKDYMWFLSIQNAAARAFHEDQPPDPSSEPRKFSPGAEPRPIWVCSSLGCNLLVDRSHVWFIFIFRAPTRCFVPRIPSATKSLMNELNYILFWSFYSVRKQEDTFTEGILTTIN